MSASGATQMMVINCISFGENSSRLFSGRWCHGASSDGGRWTFASTSRGLGGFCTTKAVYVDGVPPAPDFWYNEFDEPNGRRLETRVPRRSTGQRHSCSWNFCNAAGSRAKTGRAASWPYRDAKGARCSFHSASTAKVWSVFNGCLQAEDTEPRR